MNARQWVARGRPVVTCWDKPLVKSGSGSFLKKDLSKLLTTLRSCHFCWQKKKRRGVSDTVLLSESCPSVKCSAAFVSPRLLRGDDHASLVELILERRHHGVVAGDSVDARVLQTHVLHQTAADLHDQRDELRGDAEFSHTWNLQWGFHCILVRRMTARRLTLLITPGWQSSNRTPKALGPAFFVFFMMLIPHGDLGGLLSSEDRADKKRHCVSQSVLVYPVFTFKGSHPKKAVTYAYICRYSI